MKKITLFLLSVLCMTIIISCKKDKTPDPDPNGNVGANGNVTPEKTSVKTYEIVNLTIHRDLADTYNATFGTTAIEIVKTSDTTLAFYVPEVAAGESFLKFDLATIRFDVTKTIEVDAGELITKLTQNFDARVNALNASTPGEIAEVNSLKQYKNEVIALFNSLSSDEKRQVALFYEANKETIQSFSNNTFRDLDASTTMMKQSECPSMDFYTFYGCTADNLAYAAKRATVAAAQVITMFGIAQFLGTLPVVGTVGATGAACVSGYLLITEMAPAFSRFRHSVIPFTKANWIFGKGVFNYAVNDFPNDVNTSLNLTPSFRSITEHDKDVNPGSGHFIEAMASLSSYWNKLPSFLGSFAHFQNTESPTTLTTNDIAITNISNPNVAFLGHTDQSVKFKSISGNEENFSFRIRVTKEGFVEEKTLQGKVRAVTDSTAIYSAAVVGNWTVSDAEYPNDPPKNFVLYAGGKGSYGGVPVPNMTWRIVKHKNKYYLYEEGLWHPGYNQLRVIGNDLPNENLTYPVRSFQTYTARGGSIIEQLTYVKN